MAITSCKPCSVCSIGQGTTNQCVIEGVPKIKLEDNLIFRAVQLLQKAVGQHLPGLKFTLHKHIPMGAGLGGGSSNAAACLLGLNQLLHLNLSNRQLLELGAQLGADVPVFIQQQHAFAEGIGEKLTAVTLEPLFFILALPKVSVNTADAFKSPKLERRHPKLTMTEQLHHVVQHNHFELPIRHIYPPIDHCFKLLAASSPPHIKPRLSGTGSSVFLVFEQQQQAVATFAKLQQQVLPFAIKSLQLYQRPTLTTSLT